MRKRAVLLGFVVVFTVSLAALSGCGGGGGGGAAATPTVSLSTTSGAATVKSSDNSGSNYLVSDTTSSAKVTIPAGTLSSDTTFTFSALTPGSGGVPAAPSTDKIAGSAVQISLDNALPAGKSVTVTLPAPNGALSSDKAALYKVENNVWTDTGTTGLVDSSGNASASVYSFSQLMFVVPDFNGTYSGTFNSGTGWPWTFSGNATVTINQTQRNMTFTLTGSTTDCPGSSFSASGSGTLTGSDWSISATGTGSFSGGPCSGITFSGSLSASPGMNASTISGNWSGTTSNGESDTGVFSVTKQ